MLGVMAGEDPRDPASIRRPAPDYFSAVAESLGSIRVAWSTTYSQYPVEPEIREVVESAASVFKSLGHDLTQAEPQIEGAFYDTYMPLYLADVHTAFDQLLSQRPSDLDRLTLISLEDARRVTLSEYVQALHRLLTLRRRVEEFFSEYDLLVTPNNPVCAFPALEPPDQIDGQPVARDWTPHLSFLSPWNLAGNPWLAVPAGLSQNGLPIGALLVAASGREDLLLTAGAAFERERPWSTQIPPLASEGSEADPGPVDGAT
jgi:Asp-tRNA(Asn)/Glu-tRNA(Gln) amidotransferase A subunit family amidase